MQGLWYEDRCCIKVRDEEQHQRTADDHMVDLSRPSLCDIMAKPFPIRGVPLMYH